MLSRSVVSDSLQSHELQPTRLLCPWRFSRQEYLNRLPCPPPGDLPDPGIEPRSPTLEVDSLPSEPPGKPVNTGVGRLSLLQEILPTQELNQGLLCCRWILYQLSLQGSPKLTSVGLRALSWTAGWLSSRQSPANARGCGLNPWVKKTPWRRKWQPL